MSVVTDTLETVLTLKGEESVIGGFGEMASSLLVAAEAGQALVVEQEILEAQQLRLAAAKAAFLAPLTAEIATLTQNTAVLFESVTGFGALAAAEGVATASTVVLEAALAVLASPLVIITAAIATMTAGLVIAAKGIHEFADVQQRAFQTAVVLKNLGSSETVDGLSSLGTEIQKLTGFDDDLVVSLGGVLARFGVAGKDIPDAVRSIADAAAATGQTMDDIGSKVGRALLGQSRGLKELGISFTATGNRAKDLAKIEELLNQRFAGAGSARRNTITGAFDALSNATGNFFSAIGRFLGPALIGIINKVANTIQFFAEQIERWADRLHLPTAASAAGGVGKGLKGDPQQTKLLGDIAENTKKQADTLIRAVLGGTGAVARGAATPRDARLAFGI